MIPTGLLISLALAASPAHVERAARIDTVPAPDSPALGPIPAPAGVATPEEATLPDPSPTSAATATPSPRPDGLGAPVLFRGECTPGGGAKGCRVVAVGIVRGDGLARLPCVEGEEGVTRRKTAERYFPEGTPLDLYLRGAPAGSFVVAAHDEPGRGCANRARGRKVGSPGRMLSFVAFDPEDPVKLAPLRFPAGAQPDARSVVVAALRDEPHAVAAPDVELHEVRRLRDGAVSVIVAEAAVPGGQVVVIAEGDGPDPAAWRRTWASPAGETHALVDAFDLGADDTTEILVERVRRGEPSGWLLLRRGEQGWVTVSKLAE